MGGGGTKEVRRIFDLLRGAGVPIGAMWLQDWCGVRVNGGFTRLWWNWELDETYYPNFDGLLEHFAQSNATFLAYMNPYFASDLEPLQALEPTDPPAGSGAGAGAGPASALPLVGCEAPPNTALLNRSKVAHPDSVQAAAAAAAAAACRACLAIAELEQLRAQGYERAWNESRLSESRQTSRPAIGGAGRRDGGTSTGNRNTTSSSGS